MKRNQSFLQIEKIKENIISFLKEKADPERQQITRRFFPEPVFCYGVRLPEVRKFCRRLGRETIPANSQREIIRLAEDLLAEKELESRMAGIFLLAARSRNLRVEDLEIFERWFKPGHLDNWALIDTFSLEIISQIVLTDSKAGERVKTWILSKNPFMKRAGLVALIKPLRKNNKMVRPVLQMVLEALGRSTADDGLVAKAAGWLLREAGKVSPRELENFLLRNGRSLPRVTIRYALEKFEPGKRNYILKNTKP